MSVLVKGVDKPTDCGKCFVGDRTICAKGCPIVEVVRTCEGLYDTYTPPDKEIAKPVVEMIRRSSKEMGL